MKTKIMHDNKYKTQDRFLDLEQLIIDMLPSGSGIDAKWVVQQSQSRTITAHNSFTCYTESGFVGGYVDFYVKLLLVNMELHITGVCFDRRHQYLARKHDLRPYLESIFFDPGQLQDMTLFNNASVNIATQYG